MRNSLSLIAFCAARFLLIPEPVAADGYKHIASRIAKTARVLKRKQLAVLEFPYIDGHAGNGSRIVQERLTTLLAKQRDIRVVERTSMDRLLGEIALGYRGLLDHNSAYRLGKILDVDAVLTGSLIELPNQRIEINARLIHIPDGAILAAVESWVKREWDEPENNPHPVPSPSWFKDLTNEFADAFHPEGDKNKYRGTVELPSIPEAPYPVVPATAEFKDTLQTDISALLDYLNRR